MHDIIGVHECGQSSHGQVNTELQKCGAYEIVQLSKQRVVMKDNPAYGQIGHRFI